MIGNDIFAPNLARVRRQEPKPNTKCRAVPGAFFIA